MSARPLHQLSHHIRRNLVAYIAVVLALGGGYAIAGTSTKTISGCVVRRTGELLVKNRCGKAQQKIVWDQQGPQGPAGPTGAPGQAPPSAWAVVGSNGGANPASGITATLVSTGTYQITITAPSCAGKQNTPVISVDDTNPPAGQTTGAFPVGWIAAASGASPFTVYTGVVAGGTFTPTDRTFSVEDVCG